MNHATFLRPAAAVLAAVFACGGAIAQTVRTAPITMTDVAPLPAEDRESHGAIVLQNSMVRAQKEVARNADRLQVKDVGRATERATARNQAIEDVAAQRDSDTLRLNEMGAGALIKK